jgi:hypothetical protein
MKTKKKTKPKEIPDTYTFTDDDYDWHWANFGRICTKEGPAPDVTEAELSFFNTVNQANRLRCILKRWPTMKELRKWWEVQSQGKSEHDAAKEV